MSRTQQILSNLPYTFQTEDPRSLLFRVADAFGLPMTDAESLLTQVVQAHWVDFADLKKERIHDLALMAAIYNLAPRDDEDVETFRTHLKSYVRTYLQGSATIQGILKLAASTLALSLEDGLEPQPGGAEYLVETVHPAGDASFKLFGFQTGEASGLLPTAARVQGVRDLSSGVDLSGANLLRLELDQENLANIEFKEENGLPLDPWEIARQINEKMGAPTAAHNSHTLSLTSLKTGPDGEIQIGIPAGDAADRLLGIAPREYLGAAELPARVQGTVDHAPQGGIALVDLSQQRYLRLSIDGTDRVEVDCAGQDPQATTLDEVCEKINSALGASAAAHDGHFLALASPSLGEASRLELYPAPASDATPALLGSLSTLRYRGAAAFAAALTSRADLHLGVDLSTRHVLTLSIDEGSPVEIDCKGDDPSATTLPEIVGRINDATGLTIANHDGLHLVLTSPSTGSGSKIEVHPGADPAADAAEAILGIARRAYNGNPPGHAELRGAVVLEEPLDLRLQRRLWIRLDGVSLPPVDCARADDPAHTRVQDVVDAINSAAGTTIAFAEDGRILLQSPSLGADSSVSVRAPDQAHRRYFYHRGRVREDAATVLFGFAAGSAQGTLPEPARLTGQVDLSRGADLRVANTLRMQVDDGRILDIPVAKASRPQVTGLNDIIQAVNAAVSAALGHKVYVASERGGRLELTSLAEGLQGRIALSASTASDAGMALFGLPPQSSSTGKAAAQVVFVGLPDLARGLDVSSVYRLSLGVDKRPGVDVDLRSPLGPQDPPILAPDQIAATINAALGASFASSDGRRVTLASQSTGKGSQVVITPAADHDATAAVFGLSEARTYTGEDATTAQLAGTVDLSAGVNLGSLRHLSLEIDGRRLDDIDLAGKTTLADVLAAINLAARQKLGLSKDIAGQSSGKLVIISPTAGSASAVKLLQSTAADARQKILGDAPAVTLGRPGDPAVLTGQAALKRPVDLSKRALLRLRADGGEVREINVAGENPKRTFPDEVVTKINAVFAGLAAQNSQRQIVLSGGRSVELLAQRYFTLYEFSPAQTSSPAQPVRQRLVWSVLNESVRPEPFEWRLDSLTGVDRPRLINQDTHGSIQANLVLPAGQSLHVKLDEEGQVSAWIEAPGRPARILEDPTAPESGPLIELWPGPEVLILPVGESRWQYQDCYGDRFNQAVFGRVTRRGAPATQAAGHFAGGKICHSPGVFNSSPFAGKTLDEEHQFFTVFGSKNEETEPQASVSFVYQVHQAGRFELELPADLPDQFGGRFNSARFAQANDAGEVFRAALFDIHNDPQSLIKQIEASPTIVTAIVQDADSADPGLPVYQIPFKDAKPLVKGSHTTQAKAYFFLDVEFGYIELAAKEPGEWGNEILVAVTAAEVPGAYDVSLTYTGKDVFENARAKVREQVVFARAAGVLAEVTRK